MTRMTTAVAPALEEVEFYLTIGPLNSGDPEFTDEQLEAAWNAHGEAIMAGWTPGRPGHRPWGFWRFEVGEGPDNYEAKVLRLAELDLLFEEEVAALAEKRRWRHIDTGTEHTDPEAVELYERVTEALGDRRS